MKKYYTLLILLSIGVLAFSWKPSLTVSAAKPSDYGLKDGDLISAIFSDDPDVYIINDQGYKRLFLNPEIFKFYSHLGGFTNIKLVTPDVRDSFPTSGFFRNCEDNDQKVFGTSVEGEDMGRLHWINKSGDQAVQEDPDFFKKVFCINRKEFNWYPRGNEFRALKEVPQYSRTAEVENPVICHYPVDNPKNPQTIRVAPESLDAHFQHGDTKGACPGFLVPTLKPEIVTPTPTPTTMVYLIQPMVLKDILKIESVTPYDVANLSFGVYQVSAQYNLGAYHQGKWYEGLNPGISGPVWVEFGWPNRPDTDVVLQDENGISRKIYLPSVGANTTSYGWYYWIAEDGSSYYAHTSHGPGWPNLSSNEALRPEHLARKAGASVTPFITVLSPNGGEKWVMGESQTVKWTGSNGTRVNITLLNIDKTKEVYGLAGSIVNDGNELIKVPYDLPAGQYYLRVSCVENCSPEVSFDDSNAPFSIVSGTALSIPHISYITPTSVTVGGTVYVYGSNLYGAPFSIDGNYGTLPNYQDPSGASFSFIIPSNMSVGTHTLRVEQIATGVLGNSVTFTVVASQQAPSITVLSPNGGVQLSTRPTSNFK